MEEDNTSTPQAPEGTSERARHIWSEYAPFMAGNRGHMELLLQLMDIIKRQESAEATIEEEGMILISPNSGVAKPHPAVAIAKEAGNQVLNFVQKLEEIRAKGSKPETVGAVAKTLDGRNLEDVIEEEAKISKMKQ